MVDTALDESSEDRTSGLDSSLICCVIWGCHFIFQSLSFLICDMDVRIPALFFLEGCKNPILNQDYGNIGVYRVCILKYFYMSSQFLVPQPTSLLTQ